MKHVRFASLLLLAAALAPAQMTPIEKATDFTQLAATYAMNYGPLQWKRDELNFDLLNIGDWLNKAMATKDDLDFYELCVSYVASLNDAHDVFILPADFNAYLGFDVDIYDGKTIIERIDRKQLRPADFPFTVGDELVSIDSVATADLIKSLTKYSIAGNPLSTRRVAAAYITYRDQQIMPHAHLIPDVSTVVINLQSGGTQSFSIPWVKQGTPITLVGPVIPPFSAGASQNPDPSSKSDYMQPLKRLRNMLLPKRKFIQGFGTLAPVFTLPSSFVLHSGSHLFDSVYSGVYQAQGHQIGFIRIPDFEFVDSDEFQNEINYMQQNSDGLVLDIMRNPGGDGCLAEDLLGRVIPGEFRSMGLEIRATRSWVEGFQAALDDAKSSHAPDAVIQQYQALLDQVTAAFLTPSGRTPPVPICGPSLTVESATDKSGVNIAYTKPVMLLVDELSASAADFFAAVFQDNQRGPLFGMRTMGAGGSVNEYQVTTYSEGAATVTESLMHRRFPVLTDDYPYSNYVENIGVRPDIVQDYMTFDNLINKGSTYVQAFTDAAVNLINKPPSAAMPQAVSLQQ